MFAFCANFINAQSQESISAFSKSFEIATEKKGKEKLLKGNATVWAYTNSRTDRYM